MLTALAVVLHDFFAAFSFDNADSFLCNISSSFSRLSVPRRVLQWNVSALALVAILLLSGSSAQAAPLSRRLLEQTHSARRTLLVSKVC